MAGRALNRKELKIHDLLMEMSEATVKNINAALRCFRESDVQLARDIISNDAAINGLQHQVEERCVVAIARYQPVANDLREFISDLYVAVSLERIADHAANIAKNVISMQSAPEPALAGCIDNMGQQCCGLLVELMKAYDQRDEQRAREIAARDEDIDKTGKEIVDKLQENMRDNAVDTALATCLIWMTHDLERIGDHLTNIAERVVYMTTGEVVKLNG